MDIRNIALVRATNIIPFDSIVHPISNVPYLRKERGTEFSYAISDLLKKLSIINMENFWTKTEEEQEKVLVKNKRILESYLPYTSDYNSMVLWSLNGIVPDDSNNTFSNKDCAIIESLEEQIKKTNVVSLTPTDTAIKGDVVLSNKATILISKNRYDSLTDEEKNKLSKLKLKVVIFEGTLEQAINSELEASNLYTVERLSLTRSKNGYNESETKEELLDTISSIADAHNILQVLFWDIVTGKNDEKENLKDVKDEYKNSVEVARCYHRTFLKYLSLNLNIDNEVIKNATEYIDSSKYMQDLCDEIEKVGIDKYKEVVEKYNKLLELLKSEGKLPTPEEIVSDIKENKEFDLTSIINKLENENNSKQEIVEENEYFKILQEKYNYSNDIIDVLKKIIPAFIEYFGEEHESTILDAISSCEIHIQKEGEKAQVFLSEFFPEKKIDKIPVLGTAFYSSMPIIEEGKVNSKRLIYLTSKLSPNLQEESTLSRLVHEIGHLVKSYNSEYVISNGKLSQRSGVSTEIIQKEEVTGKYIECESINFGIEEAINCYDEEKIMSIILGREYKTNSYGHHLNDCIEKLFENKELIRVFRNAQINGTNEHIQLLGKEEFEELSDYFEDVYYPFVAPPREVMNGKVRVLIAKRDEAKAKIIHLANKYRQRKEQNFSIEQIEQIDSLVSKEERVLGKIELASGIAEEKTMAEEGKDEPEI